MVRVRAIQGEGALNKTQQLLIYLFPVCFCFVTYFRLHVYLLSYLYLIVASKFVLCLLYYWMLNCFFRLRVQPGTAGFNSVAELLRGAERLRVLVLPPLL